MEIEINDQKYQLESGLSVARVVTELLNVELSGMAIAINDKIIPRTLWEETEMQDADKMLIIKASKGG
jgi:sulfur carrier protein